MPGANFSCKIIEKKGITAISKNKLKNMEKIIEICIQAGGRFFDVANSHSLGEMALKAGVKGFFNLGHFGASKVIKM